MNKSADLSGTLNGMKDQFGQAGHSLLNWYGGLNPDVRNTVIRSLAGAAIGGAATGGIAAMTPHDKDERGAVIRPALLGALLGGTAGAALPLGTRMLKGNLDFNNEGKRPLLARPIEGAVGTAMKHPLSIGLPAAAIGMNRSALGALAHAMNNPAADDPGKPLPAEPEILEYPDRPSKNDITAIKEQNKANVDAHTKQTEAYEAYRHTGAGPSQYEGAVKDTTAPAWDRFRQALSGPSGDRFWKGPGAGRKPSPDFGRIVRGAEKDVKHMHGGRGTLAAIPLSLLAGYIGDKYIKGEY